jgi:hypothetical protein
LVFQAYTQIVGVKTYLINKPIFDKPGLFASPKYCLPFDGPGAGTKLAVAPAASKPAAAPAAVKPAAAPAAAKPAARRHAKEYFTEA